MKKTFIFTIISALALQSFASPLSIAVDAAKASRAEIAEILAKRALSQGPGKILSFGKNNFAHIVNKGKKSEFEIVNHFYDDRGKLISVVKRTHSLTETNEVAKDTFLFQDAFFFTVERIFKNNNLETVLKERYYTPANGYPRMAMSVKYISTPKERISYSVIADDLGFSLKITKNGSARRGIMKLPVSEGQIIDFKVSAAGDRLSLNRLVNNQVVETTYAIKPNTEFPVDRAFVYDLDLEQVGSRILTGDEAKKLAVRSETTAYNVTVKPAVTNGASAAGQK